MPIRGLTDRGMAFPEIGKIRKGEKKTGNKPGNDLDYFRVVFAEGEEESQSRFNNIVNDPEPDELNVLLPLAMNDVWDAWIEGYSRGRMVARSDGEHYQFLRDENMNVVVRDWLSEDQNKVPYLGERGNEAWVNGVQMKPVGRLKVVLPELERFAYLTLTTGSYNDIDNISSQLKSIYFMSELMGGTPLILKRRPKMVSVPNLGRKKMWLISIEPKEEWVRMKMIADRKEMVEAMGLTPGQVDSGFQLAGGGDIIEGDFTYADGDEFGNEAEATKESTI